MARLITVRRDDLTIQRIRAGKGYIYRDASGERISDAEFKARVKALGIPPAWQEVRLASHPRAHIQCCGIDGAGRVQYIYHPDWEVRRSQRKQKQLALLTAALPRVRRRVSQDLEAEAGSRTLAVAIGIALIDKTAMRVGRERYLQSNGTRGAGTLYSRDITVEDGVVCMKFPAKSGKVAEYCVTDAKLAAAIARIKTIPGKRLLMYRDEAGKARPLNTEALNAYLRDVSGAAVTAKDFRTLHASALAAEALARLEPAPSEAARKRQITAVTRQVAAFLRNTPVICRKSYIAPCLFKLFDEGKLAQLWAEASDATIGLKERERRLGAVLLAAA
jgi:DNA topoisomerase-1